MCVFVCVCVVEIDNCSLVEVECLCELLICSNVTLLLGQAGVCVVGVLAA